jgi:uncharacterized protein (DUF58 family)
VTLTRSASPRLWGYGIVALAGFVTALAAGRPGVAVAVVPVTLVSLAGVVLAERPTVAVTIDLGQDRVREGTTFTGVVTLTTNLPRGRVDLVVPLSGPLVVAEPPAGLAWTTWGPAGRRTQRVEATAARWGLARFGEPWIRAHGPLGLIRWQGPAGVGTTLRIVPSASTLHSLLPHPDPRASSGAHLARRPADGIEFADSRPYHAGDRLRSINWPLSTRRGDLWVNERRPERSSDLVVVVDTFADDPHGGALALSRSVRAAWLLASAHLRAHDRVGLVGFGGYPTWLTPATGEHARHQLLDRLLATTVAWTEAQRSVRMLPRNAIPPGALVVAVTPLHDLRTVGALGDLRRRGLPVSIVRVDVLDLLEAQHGAAWSPAVRIWALELERRVALLSDAGIPVVAWPGGEDAAAVLEALRRAVRAPVFRGRTA